MKKTLITFLTLSGMYFGAFAQRQPDYVSKFDTKIEALILDNLTGNVIVKEADKISAFNPQTNGIEWTVNDAQIGKMSTEAKVKRGEELSKDPDLLKIFQSTDKLSFLDNTPYIQANVNANDVIINAFDGKILFNSATTPYRVILSQYIASDDKFLFLATEGKDFKLVLFDPKTATDQWSTIVGTKEGMLKVMLAKKLGETFGTSKLQQKDEVIATDNAIYATISNKLYKIDKSAGKIIWSVPEDVHRFYLSNDLKHIITMRNSGSIISSKKALNALNTETGKPIFKEDITTKYVSYIEDWGNKFLVAHSNGFNSLNTTLVKKSGKRMPKEMILRKLYQSAMTIYILLIMK